MPLTYSRLFQTMNKAGVKKIDLRRAGVHPTTVNKLVKGQDVSTSTIAFLCELLECQPSDIMEYIPDKDGATEEVIKPVKSKLKAKK